MSPKICFNISSRGNSGTWPAPLEISLAFEIDAVSDMKNYGKIIFREKVYRGVLGVFFEENKTFMHNS